MTSNQRLYSKVKNDAPGLHSHGQHLAVAWDAATLQSTSKLALCEQLNFEKVNNHGLFTHTTVSQTSWPYLGLVLVTKKVSKQGINIMATRAEALRDALYSPAQPESPLHAVAVYLAQGVFVLRDLMPDCRDKFHLVLANSGDVTVAFLDRDPHESYRNFGLRRRAASELRRHVATNLEAFEQPQEGRQGMDADHVAACGFNDDFLLLYRKKLLAFVQRRMGWPLETIPSKVAKLLAKTLSGPSGSLERRTVRRDYALMASTFTLSGHLMNARRDVCEACGAGETKLKMCGNCKKVCYCSAECQRAHWADEHKAQCKLIKDLQQASPSDGATWSAVSWDAATLNEYFEACTL